MVTYILSRTIRQIIGQIFAVDGGGACFNALVLG